MKLNEFFQTQKNTSFTDVDKLELYQKFLYKKDLGSPIKRFSFIHAKAFVYTMVTGFLLMGLYGVYLFNGSLESPRFVINSNNNTVQADYIAQVVNFNGSFSIEHEGTILQTEKNIGNGDTIILKDGAAMVFEINSGVQSKILGPAKLTLQRIDDTNSPSKYRVNLIYGNFIQMEGDKAQNVELAVEDILIKQSDKNQAINYQLINDKGNRILKNNGANLVITKNGNKKETQLSNKQVLAIQDNDVTLFKSWGQFTTAMQKGNVSQTFALSTAKYTDIKTTINDTSTGETNDEAPVSLMSLLAPVADTQTPEIENGDKISNDISSLLGAGKSILSPEQNSKLRILLGKDFLLDDMQDAYTKANTAKVSSIVSQLHTTFNSTYNSTKSTTENINSLITILTTKYEVPPKYIANLRTLLNWLPIIAGAKDQAKTREEFSASLPNNLSFQ